MQRLETITIIRRLDVMRSERAKLVSSKRPIRSAMGVAAIGIALTGVLAIHVVHKPGVYYAETHVLFLPPQSRINPNTLIIPSGGLTALAGAVSRMVEPDPPSGQVVSPTVTLVDEGIRNGWSVTLPDDGGQFTNSFNQQFLQVQAVGSSSNEVRDRMRSLVASINTDLRKLQVQAHVPLVDRVSTADNPGQLQIYYLEGSRARALAAVLVLGLSATLTAEMLAWRWRSRSVSSGGARRAVSASPPNTAEA
jgi:hypothetical protein